MEKLPAITTYRSTLRGSLGDFVDKTPFSELLNSADLVEVAACVAYHVEEGVRLYPEIIFCQDLIDLTSQAPNSHFIEIGNDVDASAGIRKALKKLPPLTSRNWIIAIELKDGKARYGIFNPSPSPLAVEFGALLEVDADQAIPVVRVSRLCEDVVRFYAPSAGEALYSFSHKEITGKELEPNAARLAAAIFDGLDKQGTAGSAITFLKRTLDYALQKCHGALICVVMDEQQMPALLSNGIMLSPPIDFQQLTDQFLRNDENNEIKGRPFVFFDIVAGIIAFDGVVVFSRSGRLVAYNCILDLSLNKKPQQHIGGSRRAAFNMLKDHVGKDILCAYYQSQDGPSELATNG